MNGGSHIYFDHGTYESERQFAEQKRRQQLRFKFNRFLQIWQYYPISVKAKRPTW